VIAVPGSRGVTPGRAASPWYATGQAVSRTSSLLRANRCTGMGEAGGALRRCRHRPWLRHRSSALRCIPPAAARDGV